MKIKVATLFITLLFVTSVVHPTSAQTITFREYYNILPSDNYCDLDQITFAYDYMRNFSFDATYYYAITVTTYDHYNNPLGEHHWRTTGWSPSGSTVDSGTFAIIFVDEGRINLEPNASSYTVEVRYMYMWNGEDVLEWHLNTSCDLGGNQTYDATLTIDYAPYW